MGENLVIVESPAKATTIQKVLGKDFTVKSSFGHIRDLSEKKLGIDIKNGFTPDYIITPDKKKVVAELKKAAEKASSVWLASDDDREGEAISWHLAQTLNLDIAKTKRIAFHEITKEAILEALDNPRDLNLNLVMAQQARRVLDRLVGYELSPVLWRRVQPKLSAGRVQSVALRLIVDREREILAFKSQKYFKVEGAFLSEETEIKGVLETKFPDDATAEAFLEKCKDASFKVDSVEKKNGTRCPASPFTTSLLQQEASRKLGFSVNKTMTVAQRLYEAGMITYMRTDSTNLSSLAINTAKDYITREFGPQYSKVRKYKTKSKGAQEAHEAIRPTYIQNVTINGSADDKKLYSLIWKRTIASQMADAQIAKTIVKIGSDKFEDKFIAEAESVIFDGFYKVYIEGKDDESENVAQNLPEMKEGQPLSRNAIVATEKYSAHPARYTEAGLVKKLEELGIGRPSTYAPTITTIMKRGYVIKGDKEGENRKYQIISLKNNTITHKTSTEKTGAEKGKLLPENIGMSVTDYLADHFSSILDYGFTAKIEEDFDEIALGNRVWNDVISEFYGPFHQSIETTLADKTYTHVERVLGIDPATGKNVIARMGRFGPIVQIGTNDDPEKKYASMRKGQLIEDITLEKALEIFKLPRKVGSFEDQEIVAAIGRFGPYIRHGSAFVSLGKTYDPHSITEEEAVKLILSKREQEQNRNIANFEASDIQVLNGRYGPYIKQGKKNYKIPKGVDPKTLTEEACLKIISDNN
ncbi:MAG: type I DNA topoisomerase [Bacteroidales bacterium]|nr:type I DNA topoisomerase [Bacteroidales bacterium]